MFFYNDALANATFWSLGGREFINGHFVNFYVHSFFWQETETLVFTGKPVFSLALFTTIKNK
jgi:hypothetical protein